MSKFVEENERKRIQRLHSIKSSFPGQGRKKGVAAKFQKKRPSATKGKSVDRGAFQLKNLCGASVKTRSGLTVSVAGCEAAMKSDELEAMKDNVDRANKNIRLKIRPNAAVGTKGKDNCLSRDKEAPDCIPRGTLGDDHSIRDFNDGTLTKKIHAQRSKSTCLIRNTQRRKTNLNGKPIHQQDRSSRQRRQTCSTSVLDSDKLERIERENIKRTTVIRNRLKDRKPYVNRGVTVESLENEREQANKMLKELDDANLIGRMKEMQIVMDVMNTQKRQDFVDVKPYIFEDEEETSNVEVGVENVTDSCSASRNEDYVDNMPYERDSWISECSLSSFSEINEQEFGGKREDDESYSEYHTEKNWSDDEQTSTYSKYHDSMTGNISNHCEEQKSKSDGDGDSIEEYDDELSRM